MNTLLADAPKLVEPVASTPHLMLAFLAGIAVIVVLITVEAESVPGVDIRRGDGRGGGR